MTATDVLAIYGAVLGTLGLGLSLFLGYRELKKERRNIKVYIDYNVWVVQADLKIVNTGHRPVTIKRIAVDHYIMSEGKKILSEYIRSGHSLNLDDLQKLPLILEDGEQISIGFSQLVSEWITNPDNFNIVEVTVFDAEENAYHAGETVVHHEKP